MTSDARPCVCYVRYVTLNTLQRATRQREGRGTGPRTAHGASGDASSRTIAMVALPPNTARLSVEPPPPPLEPIPASADVPGGISDASRQLRALAMLSGSLTDPLTPTDAADVVERQALAVLDATSAVVVTLGEFPPNDAVDSSVLLDATPPPPGRRDGAGRAAATLTLVHAIGVPAQVGRGAATAPVRRAGAARGSGAHGRAGVPELRERAAALPRVVRRDPECRVMRCRGRTGVGQRTSPRRARPNVGNPACLRRG